MLLRLAGAAVLVASTMIGPLIDGSRAVRVSRGVQVLDPVAMFPVAPGGSRCPAAYPPAVFAGWPDSDWLTLDAIVWRESRCRPGAIHYNRNGTIDRGLAQVNSVNLGYLATYGITAPMLLDGYWNLRAARLLFDLEGWAPWQ